MIYTLIPARSGSKGIIDKNIKLINNIPLMAYSIIDALNTDELKDNVYVTTDSEEYAKIATQYGSNVVIRPDVKDTDTDTSYLRHFIMNKFLQPNDVIVLLRPTSPLRQTKILSSAVKYFKMYENTCDSLRSVHELSEPIEKMFRLYKNFAKPVVGKELKITNQPRQFFDKCYHPNGYIDILKVDNINKSENYTGNKIYCFITERVPEIDIQDDFDYCEYKLSKKCTCIECKCNK